eukprot:gene7518-11842_t
MVEEFDKDDYPEERKGSNLRPMKYSSDCEKLENKLQQCVAKKNGLYGCSEIMEKYKICITKDLDFYRKEDDRREN